MPIADRSSAVTSVDIGRRLLSSSHLSALVLRLSGSVTSSHSAVPSITPYSRTALASSM